MKGRKILAVLMAAVMMFGLPRFGELTAQAAAAPVLASQINGIAGLLAVADGNSVAVTGSANDVPSTINLNIDPGVTVNWDADVTGSTPSGRYLLNLSGGGTFNLTAALTNNSGLITVTGAGTSVNVSDGGSLVTPGAGNGMSVNIAAAGVTLNVTETGTIENEGSNSAVNVTDGASDVKINVVEGKIRSYPQGYAVNDGGTALCVNNTTITVSGDGGEVTAGSACAIKSTGSGSSVTVNGGTVKNNASSNSNPVIYMNGDASAQGFKNVIINGGTVTTDNTGSSISYVIQTTNDMEVNGGTVRAYAGRAVNLVGFYSNITVNSGLITATSGVAVCTATTDPGTVRNSSITINGGLISTTDENAVHGTGNTIYATGDNSVVTINGGRVTTASPNTHAVYSSGSNSTIEIDGGWVSWGHFAVEAHGGGSIYINGGFVISNGDGLLSDKTAASVKDYVIGAVSQDRVHINENGGEGVVVAWDNTSYTLPYMDGSDTNLKVFIEKDAALPSVPLQDVAVWGIDSEGDSGISYENGTNSGFFPLALVAVPPPVIPATYTLTVINGTVNGNATGQYEAGAPAPVSADAPPAGQEFAGWSIVSGDGSFLNPNDADTTFYMPAGDATVKADYRPVYKLTVWNGEINGGGAGSNPRTGYFSEGAVVTVALNSMDAAGYIFTGWKIKGGGQLENAVSRTTTFTMPGGDAELEPTYSLMTFVTSYTLTVINGTGGGVYYAGTNSITVTAADPPIGKAFAGWEIVTPDGRGAFADAGMISTTFTMPDQDVTVAPKYADIQYALKVEYGTGSGDYILGTPVSVKAVPPRGHTGDDFAGWTSDGGGAFGDANSADTVFTMPANSVTVTAHWTPRYLLTVFNGTGGGLYREGDKVPVTLDGPSLPDGYTFVKWESDDGAFDDASSADTIFTMPGSDAVIHPVLTHHTATTTSLLTVVDGKCLYGGAVLLSSDPNNHYEVAAGVWLAVEADAPGLKVFAGWTTDSSRCLISDPSASETIILITMPGTAVTVTANFKDQYELTVEDGTGGGLYAEGAKVTVKADPLGTDKAFGGWTIEYNGHGGFENPGLMETVFTMPGGNTTIKANYADIWIPHYTLTVINGRYDVTAGDNRGNDRGMLTEGTVVEIIADPPPAGKVFDYWKSVPPLNIAAAAKSGLVMPAENVTVTAVYKSSTTPPPPPPVPPPDGGDGGEQDDSEPPLLDTDNHTRYIRGDSNGLFSPSKTMTRAEVAQIFYNLLRSKEVEITQTFTDVPENAWYARAVSTLASLGIILGRPDGLYHPGDFVTRAQFVVLAVRFTAYAPGGGRGDVPFDDVPASYWAYDYIMTAVGYGWIRGVGGSLFAPGRDIMRSEAVTLTNRLLKRDPDKGYIDSHPELERFDDVPETHRAYYEIMEAYNGHTYVMRGGVEEWEGEIENTGARLTQDGNRGIFMIRPIMAV